jgi:hypothetical protein
MVKVPPLAGGAPVVDDGGEPLAWDESPAWDEPPAWDEGAEAAGDDVGPPVEPLPLDPLQADTRRAAAERTARVRVRRMGLNLRFGITPIIDNGPFAGIGREHGILSSPSSDATMQRSRRRSRELERRAVVLIVQLTPILAQ